MWRKAVGQFCSASTYNGQFTTIEGTSPGGRTQLPAGIRGTFKGMSVTRCRVALAPHGAALLGFVGTKDFACTSADVKGECSGTWDWLRVYFTGIDGFRYVRYAFQYHAQVNGKGTWSDVLTGGKIHVHGDIWPDR